ncbi:LysR family transcriptional regulator [Secundilactobacillus muriivasis]
MNLRHLQFFQELARTQHMSKAAENLGISQPSLSYAISKLEQELGVPLVEPDGRNIKLTAFGKTYLNYINDGLNSLAQGNVAIQQLNDPKSGHVRLGFTYTMGQRLVPELMQQFTQQPDNERISFQLGQDTTEHLLEKLADDQFDLVLASYADQVHGQATKERFQFTPIVKQAIKLAVPVNHPLATKPTIKLRDIAPYDLIMFSQKSGLRPLIDRILKQAELTPKIKYEIEEDHTIIGLVQYGMGIALVPNLPQLDQSQVILREITDNPLNHELFLITRKQHFLTPAVQRFDTFIRQYCKQHFAHQKL